MKAALVLIEMQNDYFPGGRMPLEESVEVGRKVQDVLGFYRAKKLPIMHIQQISTRPNATHFLPCTRGVEFYAATQPEKSETVIRKHYPNSFKDTNLLAFLQKQGIEHIVIAGMMTHMSIEATTRAAYDLGITCTVLMDGCTTMSLEFNHMLVPMQTVHYAFLGALSPLYATTVSAADHMQTISTRLLAETA